MLYLESEAFSILNKVRKFKIGRSRVVNHIGGHILEPRGHAL